MQKNPSPATASPQSADALIERLVRSNLAWRDPATCGPPPPICMNPPPCMGDLPPLPPK